MCAKSWGQPAGGRETCLGGALSTCLLAPASCLDRVQSQNQNKQRKTALRPGWHLTGTPSLGATKFPRELVGGAG